MKTQGIIVPLLATFCVASFSGCQHAARVADAIPEGKADSLRYTRTGKFSSTTVEATAWEKTDATVKAEQLHVRHSNAWMPNVEIELKGYERTRKPETSAEGVTAGASPLN